jgi:hypothetical protein
MKHGQNPTQAGTEQSRTSRQGTEAQGRDQMMQPRSGCPFGLGVVRPERRSGEGFATEAAEPGSL